MVFARLMRRRLSREKKRIERVKKTQKQREKRKQRERPNQTSFTTLYSPDTRFKRQGEKSFAIKAFLDLSGIPSQMRKGSFSYLDRRPDKLLG